MEVKEYFENYSKFVDSVTADVSKDDDIFVERFKLLSQVLEGNFSRLDNAIDGLCGEAGEVGDLWKKVKFHGLEYTPEIKDKFIKELGDVCWYVFQVSLALGIPVDEVINRNIEKLKVRHTNGFSSAYLNQKKGE